MTEPDGFVTTKAPQKAFPVNQFVSAFDGALQDNHETTRLEKLKSLESRAAALKNPAANRSSNGQPSRRPLQSLKPPPRPLRVQPEAGPSNSRNIRPLTSLIPAVHASQTAASSSKPKPVHNLLPIARHAGPTTPKPTKVLRPLKPPAFPLNPSRPDVSKMKSLSETNAAKSTNPFTEQGSLNLLAMVAKTTAANYVLPVDRELRRGLVQSPEKGSKAKKKQQKYLPYVPNFWFSFIS